MPRRHLQMHPTYMHFSQAIVLESYFNNLPGQSLRSVLSVDVTFKGTILLCHRAHFLDLLITRRAPRTSGTFGRIHPDPGRVDQLEPKHPAVAQIHRAATQIQATSERTARAWQDVDVGVDEAECEGRRGSHHEGRGDCRQSGVVKLH